jgi:hypothetical protein
VPDLQANAVRGAYLFSSQRRDVGPATDLRVARRALQELHESSGLGIHLAEFRAGLVGDDFVADHPGLFFMNTYSFAAARYKLRDALE